MSEANPTVWISKKTDPVIFIGDEFALYVRAESRDFNLVRQVRQGEQKGREASKWI